MRAWKTEQWEEREQACVWHLLESGGASLSAPAGPYETGAGLLLLREEKRKVWI